ncbi:MAG: EamA-like transporter family protein [Prochlorotrichaceae cyanobacterium]
MSLIEIALLLLAVCAGSAGQLFLKLGALKLGQVNLTNMASHALSIITIPELLIGLGAYGLGALAYILLLTRVNLSVAGPAAASIYLFTVLMGYFVFDETLPPLRLLGLGFIVCGVILVTAGK